MTAPPWAQLLPVFARFRPLAPAQPVCLPSRGQWLVAPLVRALRVPSHFGLLAASLSFVAEPTSFAAQPKARGTDFGWVAPAAATAGYFDLDVAGLVFGVGVLTDASLCATAA